jgi:glucuronokinase
VKARFERGDAEVQRVMRELAELADQGRDCLERGDRGLLCLLVDRNFDLRASVYDIGARDRRLIGIGRELGAGTKLCGSGGAVLAVPRAPGDLDAVASAYEAAGFHVLRPRVAGPGGFDV